MGSRDALPPRATGVLEILTFVAADPGVCLVPSGVARHYPRATSPTCQ